MPEETLEQWRARRAAPQSLDEWRAARPQAPKAPERTFFANQSTDVEEGPTQPGPAFQSEASRMDQMGLDAENAAAKKAYDARPTPVADYIKGSAAKTGATMRDWMKRTGERGEEARKEMTGVGRETEKSLPGRVAHGLSGAFGYLSAPFGAAVDVAAEGPEDPRRPHRMLAKGLQAAEAAPGHATRLLAEKTGMSQEDADVLGAGAMLLGPKVMRGGQKVAKRLGRAGPSPVEPAVGRVVGDMDAAGPAETGAHRPRVAPRRLGPGRPVEAEGTGAPRPAEGVPPGHPERVAPTPETPPGKFKSRGESGAVAIPIRAAKSPDVSLDTLPPEIRAATTAQRERVLAKEPSPSLGQRLVNTGRNVASFYRRQSPIARFEKATTGKMAPAGPTAYAEYAQGSSGRIAQTGWDEGVVESRPVASIRDALDKIPKDKRANLSDYIVADQDLVGYKADPTATGIGPPLRESGFEHGGSKSIADFHRKNSPEVVAAAEAISQSFRRNLDDMLAAQILTPEQHARITKANPRYYGPWKRILDDLDQPGSVTGNAPLGPKKVEARTGSEKPILDPLPRTFEALRQQRAVINSARVGNKIVEWHDRNPGAATAFMREIPDPSGRAPGFGPKPTPRLDFDSFVKKWEAENPGLKSGTALDSGLADALQLWVEEYAKKADEGVLAVRKGDKVRWFEFPDKDFYRAVSQVDGPHAEILAKFADSALGKAATGAARMQRLGMTGVNLDFIGSQLTKDPRNFLVNTQLQWLRKPKDLWRATYGLLENYAKSIYGGAARTKLGRKVGMEEPKATVAYRQGGAEGFYDVDRVKGDTAPVVGRKAKLGRLASKPLRSAEGALSTLESAPRQLEYETVLKKHGFKPGDTNIPLDVLVESSNAAAKVTTSFKLGSAASKAISRFYPYFNARNQGVATLLETARNNPKQFVLRVAAISTVPRLLLWAKNKDEDWYRDLPAWRKYGFWNPTDGVALPNVNIIDTPGIFIEALLNQLTDEDPEAADAIYDQVVNDFSPIGDPTKPANYAPGVLKGPVELGTGKNTFTGASINPEHMEEVGLVHPELLAREWNSKFARDMSQQFHEWFGWKMTPAEIDHLLVSYTGGTGKRLLRSDPVGEKEGADLPIIGRFLPRMKESRAVEDYWRVRQVVEGKTRSLKPLVAAGREEEAEAEFIPRGKHGLLTKLGRIDEALKGARERYKAAKDAERQAIADEMVELARAGLELMEPFK